MEAPRQPNPGAQAGSRSGPPRGRGQGPALMSCSPPAAALSAGPLLWGRCPTGHRRELQPGTASEENTTSFVTATYAPCRRREARDPHWWRTYREHFGEGVRWWCPGWACRPHLLGTRRLGQGWIPPAWIPVFDGEACSRSCVHWWWLSPASIFHIWSPSLENSLHYCSPFMFYTESLLLTNCPRPNSGLEPFCASSYNLLMSPWPLHPETLCTFPPQTMSSLRTGILSALTP